MSEEPKRVFCKDCKHRELYRFSDFSLTYIVTEGRKCMAEPAIIANPIYGDEEHRIDCEVRNAAFDCKLFEAGRQPMPWVDPPPTPPSEPQFVEFTPPKKPWWRFWS